MLGQGKLLMRNCAKLSALVRHGSHGYPGGVPGNNFPLNFDLGKYALTGIFTAFFGVGLGAPWLVIRHQLVRD